MQGLGGLLGLATVALEALLSVEAAVTDTRTWLWVRRRTLRLGWKDWQNPTR
jgi:hypothetical protein